MATALRLIRVGGILTDVSSARAEEIAEDILERLDGDVRLALPLGLGKPIVLTNALTRLVTRTKGARLSIRTALTLEHPDMSHGMARRFLEPARERLFGRYPQLEYARMLREGGLPKNIEVSEFFLLAGRWLSVPNMQRNYIAANYTHALDMLRRWQPNLVLQLFARDCNGTLSLSCNTDITAALLKDRQEGCQDFLMGGEVNTHLPFMQGDEAEVPRSDVDWLIEKVEPDYEPFSVVKQPVGLVDHAIGLHVARLVKDGGTLQIGIGTLGDAIAHALTLRHRGEAEVIQNSCPFAGDVFGESGPFEVGLYSATEMLVDGLLHLFEAGIVKREAEDGAVIHAAFFVDCRDFYRRLRNLGDADRARIRMVPVTFTNTLYGDTETKRAARRDARFVNAAMKATLLGGIVSDMNEQAGEVSGIGGQFNFVEQAFALDEARSVIAISSTRTKRGRTTSNIVWEHSHESVPRFYRDLVVTEYGIADLRGKTDEETVTEMLRVTDSRFQDELLAKAKKAGKIADDFRLPDAWRNNTPQRLTDWLGVQELPDFPFGTDFDAIERRLLPALDLLAKSKGSYGALGGLALRGMRKHKDSDADLLDRMELGSPKGLREHAGALVLKGAIATVKAERSGP